MYTPFIEKWNKIENIEKLKLKHLKELIENEISEWRFLDYKKELNTDISKDVAAFANSMWWWLIIWMQEWNNWVAWELVWIDGKKIHDIIQLKVVSNIEPTPVFEIKNIEFKNKVITIVKVYEWYDTPYIHTSWKIYVRKWEWKQPIKTDSITSRLEVDKLLEKWEKLSAIIEDRFKLWFDEAFNSPFFIFNWLLEPYNYFSYEEFYSDEFTKKLESAFNKIPLGFTWDATVDSKIHSIQTVWDYYNIEFASENHLEPKFILRIYVNWNFSFFLPINTHNISLRDLNDMEWEEPLNLFKCLVFQKFYKDEDVVNYLDVFSLILSFHIYFNWVTRLLISDKKYDKNMLTLKYSMELWNIPWDSLVFYDWLKFVQEAREKWLLKTWLVNKRIPIFPIKDRFLETSLNDDWKNYIFGKIFGMFWSHSFNRDYLIDDYVQYIFKLWNK